MAARLGLCSLCYPGSASGNRSLPPWTLQQAMEAGLGLPTSAPTAQELQSGQQLEVGSTAGGSAVADEGGSSLTDQERVLAQLQQQQAAANSEGQAAIQAALHGSFGGPRAGEPAGQVRGAKVAVCSGATRCGAWSRSVHSMLLARQDEQSLPTSPLPAASCRVCRAASQLSRHSRHSRHPTARQALLVPWHLTTRLPT